MGRPADSPAESRRARLRQAAGARSPSTPTREDGEIVSRRIGHASAAGRGTSQPGGGRSRGWRIAACFCRAALSPRTARFATLRGMTRPPPASSRHCAHPCRRRDGCIRRDWLGPRRDESGLEDISAAKVQQKASAALRSASNTHVRGTGVVGGSPSGLDLRLDGSSLAGTLTTEGSPSRSPGSTTPSRSSRIGWD